MNKLKKKMLKLKFHVICMNVIHIRMNRSSIGEHMNQVKNNKQNSKTRKISAVNTTESCVKQ